MSLSFIFIAGTFFSLLAGGYQVLDWAKSRLEKAEPVAIPAVIRSSNVQVQCPCCENVGNISLSEASYQGSNIILNCQQCSTRLAATVAGNKFDATVAGNEFDD